MIDWTKPLQTNETPPETVRLLGVVEPNGGYSHVVAVKRRGFEAVWTAKIDGYVADGVRVVNVPEKHVLYVNCYQKPSIGGSHWTRDEADRNAMHNRIACIRVEFTEGQFDD